MRPEAPRRRLQRCAQIRKRREAAKPEPVKPARTPAAKAAVLEEWRVERLAEWQSLIDASERALTCLAELHPADDDAKFLLGEARKALRQTTREAEGYAARLRPEASA